MHEHTVDMWRRRFAEKRIEVLSDECRSGRPRTVTDEKVAEVVERRTRDCVRHGTTTLFAALDVASGAIQGETGPPRPAGPDPAPPPPGLAAAVPSQE